MTRESAVYVGRLSHARHGPRRHGFAYRVYLLYLDLDELPALLAGPGPLRAGRFGLLSFDRSDYLGGAGDLAEAARDRVQTALGFRPAGPVRLLTHVRSLGYVFNPVSFYYCFAADGRSLEAVVAEITNTPWGERHAYVVRAGPDGAVDAKVVSTSMVRDTFDLEGVLDLNSPVKAFWMKFGTPYIDGKPFIWSESQWKGQKLREVPDIVDGQWVLLNAYVR